MIPKETLAALIFLVGIFCMSHGRALGKIYTWTDENGVKHFSTVNVPADVARSGRNLKDKDPCADYTNDYAMKFVTIKPGTFSMGSPSNELGRSENNETLHRVTLTRSYQIQATEVTQKQWQTVMGDNPSFHLGDRLPVHRVSWSMAHEFIHKLNVMDPDGNYRLPTEAEWEYACRAGSQAAFSSGPIKYEACLVDPNLNAVGWYCGNSDKKPKLVGLKAPNAWGLFDMHGNVTEFCQDFYDGYPSSALTDPKGPNYGSNIVARGGGYRNNAAYCRSAYRFSFQPDRATKASGLRLARTIFCGGEDEKQAPGATSKRFTFTESRPAPKNEIYENPYGMRFIRVLPGSFKMGSNVSEMGRGADELKISVSLTSAYYLQTTETTRRQWFRIMGPEDFSSGLCTRSDCPIDNVSWQLVQQFIERLNATDPNGRYRLPTEAEWEYACRAGSKTPFANGGFQNLTVIGWYHGNSGNVLHPVGRKQPNAWGIFDMHGNLTEWCHDYYKRGRSSTHKTNPMVSRPVRGSFKRVVRGGSYKDTFKHCRSAARSGLDPHSRLPSVGFRLVYLR